MEYITKTILVKWNMYEKNLANAKSNVTEVALQYLYV